MKNVFNGVILTMFSSVFLIGCGGYDSEGPPTVYDSSRLYALPYEAGFTSDLYQGYFGSVSHTGEYSLDFLMPVGTKILAARDGTVEQVVEDNTSSCGIAKNCLNNYVYIRHVDGTQARYLHIDTNGACVKVGDYVGQGDVIALSGDIGISMTPHLHFQVVSADPFNLEAADEPTFVDVDNGGTGIPVAKVAYTSTNEIQTDHCLNNNVN